MQTNALSFCVWTERCCLACEREIHNEWYWSERLCGLCQAINDRAANRKTSKLIICHIHENSQHLAHVMRMPRNQFESHFFDIQNHILVMLCMNNTILLITMWFSFSWFEKLCFWILLNKLYATFKCTMSTFKAF